MGEREDRRTRDQDLPTFRNDGYPRASLFVTGGRLTDDVADKVKEALGSIPLDPVKYLPEPDGPHEPLFLELVAAHCARATERNVSIHHPAVKRLLAAVDAIMKELERSAPPDLEERLKDHEAKRA